MSRSSWKTTLAAIVGIVTALGTLVLNPLMDSDPATLPHWPEFFAIAATAVQGFFARDNDKSSEQVGVN